MRPIGQSLLASVLLLALATPAMAAKSKPPAAPSKTTGVQLRDPMVFYLARGEANACGPGCSEWIAAEGAINQGATRRMRAFLKRQAGSQVGKRPIYFNSPGGITSESVSMGRLMRERGMTARVGRTIPSACDVGSPDCVSVKRSGSEVTARLTSTYSQCNSACVYAIVGARTREIAPEAHLGIHASKTVLVGYLPDNVTIPAHLRARFKAQDQQQIRRYLIDMGIAPGLLDAAEKIPHEKVRPLTRAEMVKFNIDTRNVVESGWVYEERFNDSGVIYKSIDVTESGSAEYRKTLLRVSCLGDKFAVGYVREVGPKENTFSPIKLVAASESFKLAPPLEPVPGDDATHHYDVRRTLIPMQAFESAAAEDRIELAPDAAEGKPTLTKLSTIGLASALSSLTRRCNQHPFGGAALVPRQSP